MDILITKVRNSAFSREIIALLILFAASVLVFASYVVAQKRADAATEQRYQSEVLIDELRQSSVDLMRMAHSYIISGNPIYKQHYQEILDIRDGVRSRPLNYHSIYWDLVMNDDVRPSADSGKKISLMEEMRQAAFTPGEFEELSLAMSNWNRLIKIETDAMKLSEARGSDAEELWQRARLLVYGSKYHEAKADIMRPIAAFDEMVDQRTRAAVRSAENLALALRYVLTALIVALMFEMWRTYRTLLKTLGSSVDEVKNKIDKIASGNFSSTTADDFHQQNTVSEWLTTMQKKLHDHHQEQQSLTKSLAAEKERAQVTLACIGDAVVTTDERGRVTFLNQVAEKLTGWPLLDAAGKPLTEIFHIVNEASRQPVINPVDQVLKEGKTVLLANHTILISRNKTEYNIEDSAAPIYLGNGELLGCVLVFHDVTEKHRLLRDVRWQAGHDVLTGLPNRALLADRFERALATSNRQHDGLAVCLLDLDEFKPVNDIHGHGVGDRLLVKAAERLIEATRAEDTVARMGGDEFVLLLGGLHSQAETEATLQRILEAMTTPYVIDNKMLKVSASIGVVLYPNDTADPDTLLRHADQAMYLAKQLGRNRYHFFDVLQDQELQTAHQTLTQVGDALRNNELCLYYQPKVNMRNGTVVGMEALLRWHHPQRGMLIPGMFLPMVEQTDLIAEIGEWVIETALTQIEHWQTQGKLWPVSVNIAARHLQNPDFLLRLKILLANHPNVPPHLLQIEILESVAQHDLDQVSTLIAQCQKLGVSFALDDFGTGYSSLNYLKHLPANTLKIDQSFVRDMLEDREDMALIEAIIGLAHVFERNLIAEGVESSAHGVLLMRLGCDVAQGHAIAHPMPAALVLDWERQFVPDEKWQRWAKVAWHLDDFPLLVAEQDHTHWVDQILRGLQDPSLHFITSQLTNHHQCRFGLWYDGKGQSRYGHLPEFIKIESNHMQVHRIGAEIIRLRDAGDFSDALVPTMLQLREEILEQLKNLQSAVAKIS